MSIAISWPRILALIPLALLFTAPPTFGAPRASTECLTCHDRAGFRDRYAHQPVARGRCLACHLPHVSRYANLLMQPEPELCLSCHQQVASALKKDYIHSPIRQTGCTPCR
ncbi:MAG TPA: hypothetical protein ENJ73_01245, partial [Desulfobacterales bacterium]|nr:hypothetical protein [Desulfobacterales bacterium]